MMKRWLGVVLFVVALLGSGSPAGAITGGQIDGNRHPNVALIYYYNEDGRFRCSATLISPTVLVTAAHCTDGTLGKTLVTFAPVAPTPLPTAADDPGDLTSETGFTTVPTGWLGGTAYTHPEWDGELQLNDLHDVGVIVLDQPYTAAEPALLPTEGYLEDLSPGQGGLNDVTFELVGYGVFFEKPSEGPQKPTSVADRTRRYTTAVGQNLSSQVLKLAESSKDKRAGGGSCFGDSGGPAFHDGILVAVTSFGASQFCRSSGGYYRLDTEDARSFLDDFVSLP